MYNTGAQYSLHYILRGMTVLAFSASAVPSVGFVLIPPWPKHCAVSADDHDQVLLLPHVGILKPPACVLELFKNNMDIAFPERKTRRWRS